MASDYPMATVDAAVMARMDRSFADQGEVFRHAQNVASAGDDKVSEILRLGAAQMHEIVQAVAAGVLLNEGLAGNILAQRSAGGQPQAAGGPLPVPPKA